MVARRDRDHHVRERLLFEKLLMLLLALFVFQSGIFAQTSLETIWSEILSESVSSGELDGVPLNVVDYQRINTDARFRQLISDLQKFDPTTLESESEKMAFWINVYNIAAVKMVLGNLPLKSIRDAGSTFSPVWKKKVIVIGENTLSLGQIEHDILRKMGDARIHFAIVCASVSCPDLRLEAYNAERLDLQLDDQSKMFLLNSVKGFQFGDDKKSVYVSSIFKWFKKDFGGVDGIRQFVFKYTSKDLAGLSVKFLHYNWNLNGK